LAAKEHKDRKMLFPFVFFAFYRGYSFIYLAIAVTIQLEFNAKAQSSQAALRLCVKNLLIPSSVGTALFWGSNPSNSKCVPADCQSASRSSARHQQVANLRYNLADTFWLANLPRVTDPRSAKYNCAYNSVLP
jgi:hypothetical protein